jgi:hypothetical protein
MKVISDEVVEIIKRLVDLGVVDFNYYGPNRYSRDGMVEVSFQDDDEQRVNVSIKIKAKGGE